MKKASKNANTQSGNYAKARQAELFLLSTACATRKNKK
jgi:hypothetical protein